MFNRAADRKQVVQLGFAAVISKYSAPWGQWSSRNLQPLQPNGCRFTPVAVNHPHRDHLEMVGAFWSMRFRIGMTHYDYESLWITSNSSDSLVMSSHFHPSTLQAGPIFHTLDFPGNHGGWSGDKKWDGIGWGSGTHPKFVPLSLRSATFSSPSYMLRKSCCKELLAKWDAEHVRRPRKGGTSSRHLQLWSAIVCR